MYMENTSLIFPQRKIKKSYRSVTGFFPSVKNNRSVAFESTLEKRLFLSLEFDDTVQSYVEQPQLQILEAGRSKTYSADCYVKHTDASNQKDSIVEVKYVSELRNKQEQLERKFKAVATAVKNMGMEFTFFTDETYSPVYLDNLDFLYRYKTQSINNDNDSLIIENVKEPISAFKLADSLAQTKTEYFVIANAIWELVSSGRLHADLNKEALTMNSIIWRDDERH